MEMGFVMSRAPTRLFVLSLCLGMQAGLLSACGGSTGEGGETVTLKVASSSGKDYPARLVVEGMMKRAKAKSNGRLDFRYYKGESLVKLNDSYKAVTQGTVDIGVVSPAYEPDRLGIAGVIQTEPFNFPRDGFEKIWRHDGQFYDFISPYFHKADLKLLSWPNVPGAMILSRKPMTKASDWKGQLIRVSGGVRPAIKEMGASPVEMGIGEAYSALQRGTVDAIVCSPAQVVSYSLYEVAPYVITGSNFYHGSLEPVINEKVYRDLPKDLSHILNRAAVASEKKYYAKANASVDADVSKVVKHDGVKAAKISPSLLSALEAAAKRGDGTYQKKFDGAWRKYEKLRAEMERAAEGS